MAIVFWTFICRSFLTRLDVKWFFLQRSKNLSDREKDNILSMLLSPWSTYKIVFCNHWIDKLQWNIVGSWQAYSRIYNHEYLINLLITYYQKCTCRFPLTNRKKINDCHYFISKRFCTRNNYLNDNILLNSVYWAVLCT